MRDLRTSPHQHPILKDRQLVHGRTGRDGPGARIEGVDQFPAAISASPAPLPYCDRAAEDSSPHILEREPAQQKRTA